MSEHDVPKYSPNAAKSIARDRGISEDSNDSVRIAATTMDGASHNRRGGINSTQTNCDYLKYDEGLPRSRDAEMAAQSSRQSAASALGISIHGMSPREADKAIETAVNQKYKLK